MMGSKFRRGPGPAATPGERAVLAVLAPVRVTLERIVKRQHEQRPLVGATELARERAVASDVELLWTLVLESYRRGAEQVQVGLHRGEGLDHPMIDEAVEFAMRDWQAGKGAK